MAPKRSEQASIRVVIQRAGTSKGLFHHEKDLPARRLVRDRLLARLIGSPNVSQVDGLGDSRPITSKVAALSASEREDADVDHPFAQRNIAGADYAGSRGNISSGVGSICLAAASGTPGSTLCEATDRRRESILRIEHPSGITPAIIEAKPIDEALDVASQNLSVSRATDRLMNGRAYHP